NVDLWHLEIGGLVQNAATWRFQDLMGFKPTTQETTLMCISNGLDAGLISNAVWKGLPLRDLLDQAGVLSGAARVRLQGVDNYTDTIPLEKAMAPTTLLAYEMNSAPLSDRHGYPLRVIVPGYFGEKHVKWLTRIEVTDANAKGFYEAQGWGPDFIVPTRSRIDVPDDWTFVSLDKPTAPIEVKGMAYGGDRGISRVEVSFDDGRTWSDAEIYDSCTLRRVLSFIDGESDHCWERLRRADCRHLRRAREPQSAGAGRQAAWWATLHDHPGGKLSRISGRNRWARANSQHA